MVARLLVGSGNVTSTTAQSSATVTTAKPANVQDGDLLVWFVGHRGPGALSGIPAGWTEQASKMTSPYTLSVLTKPIPSAAAETATSYTVTAPTTSRQTSAMAIARGVDLSDPILNGTVVTSGTASTVLPGVTTPEADVLLVAVALAGFSASPTNGTNFVPTIASGMTTVLALNDQPIIISGGSHSTLVAWQEPRPTAGATGTRTVTYAPAAANSGGMMFGLNSAPATTPVGNAAGSVSVTAAPTGSAPTITRTATSTEVIAHRGTQGSSDPKTEEQTSTLPSINSEVNGVEVDLQVPSDYATTGKVYLCHDTTVDRTSPNGSTGTVTAMTSAQLDAAGIVDLATYLAACAPRYFRTIMLHTYDLSAGPFAAVAAIVNASAVRARCLVMCNAAGSQASAQAGLASVRAVWSGRVGVFQMTATNWAFYEALFSTFGVEAGFLPPGDSAYTSNRGHVATLKAAGYRAGASTVDTDSVIQNVIDDGCAYLLTNVSNTTVARYDPPDNLPAGSAAGTVQVTGAPQGSQQPSGQAAGTVNVTGAPTGTLSPAGQASGAVVVSAAASGSRTSTGDAAGTVSVSGSPTGVTPSVPGSGGSAAGAVTVTGAPVGSKAPGGTATGSVAVAAAPEGATSLSGTPGPQYVLVTGAPTGSAPPVVSRSGSAVGAVVVVGAPAGVAPGLAVGPVVHGVGRLRGARWTAGLRNPDTLAP